MNLLINAFPINRQFKKVIKDQQLHFDYVRAELSLGGLAACGLIVDEVLSWGTLKQGFSLRCELGGRAGDIDLFPFVLLAPYLVNYFTDADGDVQEPPKEAG